MNRKIKKNFVLTLATTEKIFSRANIFVCERTTNGYKDEKMGRLRFVLHILYNAI